MILQIKHMQFLGLILILNLILFPIVKAEVYINLHLEIQGSLSSSLSDEQKKSVKTLVLTGEIDARDFRIIRDNLQSIEYVDIEGARVNSYTGNEGTLSIMKTYSQDEIPERAFYENKTIKMVLLSRSTTKIANRSFSYCKNLEEIYIHEKIHIIEDYAFLGCDNLNTFEVSTENISYSSEQNILYNKDKSLLIQSFSNSRNIVLPPTVIHIYKYAFYSKESMEEIEFPNGLNKINHYAFTYCNNLKKADIPISVKSIGSNAFAECFNLECDISNVELSAAIGDNAFYLCKNIKGVFNVKNQTKIPKWSFYRCEKLNGINFNDNKCVEILQYAFSENKNLSGQIVFPSSINLIDIGAFSDCEKITGIQFNSSNLVVKSGAFRNCTNMEEILNLPSEMTKIQDFTFSNCILLNTIEFPEKIKEIGNYAFENCINLADTLSLPNSLEILGKGSFSFCNSLKVIIVPESLKEIRVKSFMKCEKIEEIHIPSIQLADLQSNIKKAFSQNVLTNATLKVPLGSLELFKSSSWGVFCKIVECQL